MRNNENNVMKMEKSSFTIKSIAAFYFSTCCCHLLYVYMEKNTFLIQ